MGRLWVDAHCAWLIPFAFDGEYHLHPARVCRNLPLARPALRHAGGLRGTDRSYRRHSEGNTRRIGRPGPIGREGLRSRKMPTLWFILVAFMLTTYVLLDGFDLGAGIIHMLVARTDTERRLNLRAIGPVWDGNEVWLIAAGGTLFFTFPLLYASSFSGFYLPLIIVLWLLMVRGISLELRSRIDNPVRIAFRAGLFFLGRTLLAIFYG